MFGNERLGNHTRLRENILNVLELFETAVVSLLTLF
jgi:hypothetical protein